MLKAPDKVIVIAPADCTVPAFVRLAAVAVNEGALLPVVERTPLALFVTAPEAFTTNAPLDWIVALLVNVLVLAVNPSPAMTEPLFVAAARAEVAPTVMAAPA